MEVDNTAEQAGHSPSSPNKRATEVVRSAVKKYTDCCGSYLVPANPITAASLSELTKVIDKTESEEEATEAVIGYVSAAECLDDAVNRSRLLRTIGRLSDEDYRVLLKTVMMSQNPITPMAVAQTHTKKTKIRS